MFFKYKFSRLIPILKAVSFGLGLMTGILALTREAFNLFFPDSDIVRQREVFWSCVRIAFIVSAFAAWIIQYRKARDLETRIERIYSGFNIQVEDISISSRDFEKFTGIVYLTIKLSVTNTKSEAISINSCRLLVEKDSEQVEGELQQDIYLEEKEYQENIFPVFLQGITKNYTPTFKFYESDNSFTFYADSLENKPCIILLIDGYGREYKIEAVTPKDLLKDFKV